MLPSLCLGPPAAASPQENANSQSQCDLELDWNHLCHKFLLSHKKISLKEWILHQASRHSESLEEALKKYTLLCLNPPSLI